MKIGRLVRMHADQMEDIDAIPAGYIGAILASIVHQVIPLRPQD